MIVTPRPDGGDAGRARPSSNDATTMDDGIGFLGGFLTGAAGSLHCIGLCGGISASLLFASGGGAGLRSAAAALVALQLGRVAAYVTLGTLAGAGGAAVALLLDAASALPVLRALAAASLMLAGLSAAGVLPNPVLGGFRRIVAGPGCSSAGFSRLPFALGMAWGLAPCGMVYSALLTAALTGSPAGGARFMLGFGLATVPALALFGTAALAARYHAAAHRMKAPLGWSLVALGLLSMAEPAAQIGALCAGG